VVEVEVAELRRQHPRSAKRIRRELLRRPPTDWVVPSTRTINRILVRHGLIVERKPKRPRESYARWQRPEPVQLWQIDIVDGLGLINPATGVVREAKIVTGEDDHSRFGVIAPVVERATGRAVCVDWRRRCPGSGCRRRSSRRGQLLRGTSSPSGTRQPTWPQRPTGGTPTPVPERRRDPALQDAIFAACDRQVGVG
jgi:hypothetical protein